MSMSCDPSLDPTLLRGAVERVVDVDADADADAAGLGLGEAVLNCVLASGGGVVGTSAIYAEALRDASAEFVAWTEKVLVVYLRVDRTVDSC